MRLLRVVYPKRKREKPAREFLPLLGPFNPRNYRKPKPEPEPARTPSGIAPEPALVGAVCAWLEGD